MRLICAPLEGVEHLIARERPDRVISLLAPGERGPWVEGPAHLRLELNDIVAPAPRLTLARAGDVETMLRFALAPPSPGSILVHCRFGVSRSPAAVLVLACAARPDLPEIDLARQVRRLSSQATPNPRLIQLGDEALKRDQRLVEAAKVIGRGAEYIGPEMWTLKII